MYTNIENTKNGNLQTNSWLFGMVFSLFGNILIASLQYFTALLNSDFCPKHEAYITYNSLTILYLLYGIFVCVLISLITLMI